MLFQHSKGSMWKKKTFKLIDKLLIKCAISLKWFLQHCHEEFSFYHHDVTGTLYGNKIYTFLRFYEAKQAGTYDIKGNSYKLICSLFETILQSVYVTYIDNM